MSNRIKGIKVIALMVASSMFLSSCSIQSKLNTEKEPVVLTIWHYYNGVQQTKFDEMVAEFNQTEGLRKGIIVEAISKNSISELNDSIISSVNQEIGAEELPDIFASYAETAYQVDKAGKLADIGKYFTEAELSEYVTGYIDEGRFSMDGTLKIFPVAKSTEVMILNKTDWEKFCTVAEVTEQDLRTWEGLERVSGLYYEYTDSMTPDVEGDGKSFFGRDSVANYMVVGAEQLGCSFDRLADGERAEDVLDKGVIKRLWANYYVPYVKGYYAANSRFRSDDAKTGDIIALICSTTGATYFPSEVTVDDDSSYPIDSLVLSVPNFEGTEPYIVQQGAGMCVTAGEESVESASAEFLKWFTEESRNVDYAVNSGYLPVKKSAQDVDKLQVVDSESRKVVKDTLRVAIDEIGNYQLYTSKPYDRSAEVRDYLGDYISRTAKEARNEVAERVMSGEPYASVVESYTTEDAYDDWYNDFIKGFDDVLR